MMPIFATIVAVWNIFVFTLYAVDKNRAVKNKRRISENALVCSALMCGGLGAFMAMYCLRHKTKHLKFRIFIPISMVITLIPFIHITHALTLDKIVMYKEISFYSENWPAELNGYRVSVK